MWLRGFVYINIRMTTSNRFPGVTGSNLNSNWFPVSGHILQIEMPIVVQIIAVILMYILPVRTRKFLELMKDAPELTKIVTIRVRSNGLG